MNRREQFNAPESDSESAGNKAESNNVEKRGIRPPLKKAFLTSLLALGMAGFWAGGSQAEAQDASMHQSIEQKEATKPDFFQVNALVKEFAAYRLAKLPPPPNERWSMEDQASQRKKVAALRESMIEKYGEAALGFMEERVNQKRFLDSAKEGSDDKKGLMANFSDDQKLMEDVMFDKDLPQLMLSHKKGYLIKQVELDGKKIDTLVEYVYEPADTTGSAPEFMFDKINNEMNEIDKEASMDPVAKGRFVWGDKIELPHFTIKGSDQHPGWYGVYAVSEKTRDRRAPVF